MFENNMQEDPLFQELDHETTHMKSGEENYPDHMNFQDTPETKNFKTANVGSGSTTYEDPDCIYNDYTIDGGFPIQQNDDGACFIQVQAESSVGHTSIGGKS